MRLICLYLIMCLISHDSIHASDMRENEEITLQVISRATSINVDSTIFNENNPIPVKSSSNVLPSRAFESIFRDIETNGPDRMARAVLIKIRNTWSNVERALNGIVILAAASATIVNSINLSEDCRNSALLTSGTTFIIIFPVTGIIKQTISFALNYREQQLSYVQKEIEKKQRFNTKKSTSTDVSINSQLEIDGHNQTIHLVKASYYAWSFFQSLSQTLAFLTSTAEAVIVGFDTHSPCEDRTRTKVGITLAATSVVNGILNLGINYMCQKRQQQLQKLQSMNHASRI